MKRVHIGLPARFRIPRPAPHAARKSTCRGARGPRRSSACRSITSRRSGWCTRNASSLRTAHCAQWRGARSIGSSTTGCSSRASLARAAAAALLVAFRCKGRHVYPSCRARRLAEWSMWLDERLLAPGASTPGGAGAAESVARAPLPRPTIVESVQPSRRAHATRKRACGGRRAGGGAGGGVTESAVVSRILAHLERPGPGRGWERRTRRREGPRRFGVNGRGPALEDERGPGTRPRWRKYPRGVGRCARNGRLPRRR